jgi:hypothetical protein
MTKINVAWHDANPMPQNAKREQHIDWHVHHAEACACRDVPESIRDAVAERRAGSKT